MIILVGNTGNLPHKYYAEEKGPGLFLKDHHKDNSANKGSRQCCCTGNTLKGQGNPNNFFVTRQQTPNTTYTFEYILIKKCSKINMFHNNLVKLVEIIIILKLLGKNDENSIVNPVGINKKWIFIQLCTRKNGLSTRFKTTSFFGGVGGLQTSANGASLAPKFAGGS